MKAPTQLRTERGYLKDMKLSVLHSTPRPGRITSLISPNEARENLHKQIGRSPIKDLPTAANVMYTIYAIALAIVLSYRHFYRRHFQCQHTRNVSTHVMSAHKLCHFKGTRYVTSKAHVMSLQKHTLCHFKGTRYVTSKAQVMSLQRHKLCHFKGTRYVTSNAHVMSLQRHTLCHFKGTRYVTSKAHVMSLQMNTQCHFKCTRNVSTYVMSLPMYTIIPFFDHTLGISNQPLEPICNLYAVNQGGK